MSQIATTKDSKVVITREDVGFPGRGMYDAASELERRYGKILLLINSGSGESEDAKDLAESLERYLEETASEKFSMSMITSNPDSSIAHIVQRHGHVVKLEGRGRDLPSEVYSEAGIMGDVFELGSLFLLQMMTEAVVEGGSVGRVFELIKEEFSTLEKIINTHVNSRTYKVSLDFLERRSDVFLGGTGTAEEVAKMTAIRLFHIKKFLGDNVYIAKGVNTPRPRTGDFEILISYSGETKPVVGWGNTFKNLGGTVLSIIGNKGSPLEEKSDLKILLEEKVQPGRPRRFYMRTAFLLSYLPILLTERLSHKGLKLPEYILNWYHSAIE
jgi:6-phospho-3-hexuloisomerase